MRAGLLLALALASTLAAQPKQTVLCGGLKFGMSVAEARKALPYPSTAVPRRERAPGKSVPGIRRLEVPKGLLGSAPVIAAVYFEEKPDAVTGVLLISNHHSTNYCDMPGNLEKQAANLLWQTFLSELTKQNGDPNSTRSAPGEASTVNSMTAVWNGAPDSPDITLLLMGSCKGIDVTVTYRAAGASKP